MSHGHEQRLLILTDVDGSIHNAIVEAVAGRMPLERCDILTHWDICSRLAEADAACLKRVAEAVRNGKYRVVLLVARMERQDAAEQAAKAARVLIERMEHPDVRAMVLREGTLATTSR